MAIHITKPSKEKLIAEFDDREFMTLQFIRLNWGFKDEASVLQYALGALFKAADKKIEITDENGKKQSLAPAELLLAATPYPSE
jgi:hypothetical protein